MNRNKLLSLTLALTLLLALAGCGSKLPAPVVEGEYTIYTNQGYALSIPNKYHDLLLIERPTEGQEMLFRVSEKASVNAAKKLFPGENAGGGFLFGIGLVTEKELHTMQCYDMSGRQVFARDSSNCYYIYYHPTDVQLLREGECTDADWEQWLDLCDWAAHGGDIFMGSNDGLTPYLRSNTDLDIFLCRLAYLEGKEEFTLTRPGSDDVLTPSRELSLPHLYQLIDGIFTHADHITAPDCEYISLNFPDAQTRFDFFLSDTGKSNYIRQVFGDGTQTMYLAAYDIGIQAGQTMLGWYIDAMQEAQ